MELELKCIDTLNFIDEYRKRVCLWNSKAKCYKNLALRNKSYEELSTIFKTTVLNVKKKINQLRSNFFKEQKLLIDSSKASGYVGKSTIYWYDALSFIESTKHISRSKTTSNRKSSISKIEKHEMKQLKYSNKQTRYENIFDEALSAVTNILNKEPDEIQNYCRSLEDQFRGLPSLERCEAMYEVNQILFQKRLKCERRKLNLSSFDDDKLAREVLEDER